MLNSLDEMVEFQCSDVNRILDEILQDYETTPLTIDQKPENHEEMRLYAGAVMMKAGMRILIKLSSFGNGYREDTSMLLTHIAKLESLDESNFLGDEKLKKYAELCQSFNALKATLKQYNKDKKQKV